MNTHLKQLWAAMKLPKNFKKSYKFFCLGLDIRVSQIVDSDALDACCLCTPVHLMVEIAFGYRENTIFLFQTVLHFEKLLHLLAEKVGHLNGAVAFLCFR